MRAHASKSTKLLELSEMRLPLIALIDVILFLLMYFLLAGSLEAEERELAAALAASSRGTDSPGQDLEPQAVEVASSSGVVEFRIGSRVATTREALMEILTSLPHDPGVVVKVTDGVPVGSAALAVQACRDSGFVKVSYQSAGAARQ